MNAASQLRALIKGGPLLLPGVFNAISARSAEHAGAKALYISGAGITNASLAVPDIALATLTEFVGEAGRICASTHLPAICDVDTGFGDVHNVARTIRLMEQAGLAGVHMEDQVFPKRCGHLDGKQLIPAEDMSRKIRSAVKAKSQPEFLLIARTDARGVEGLDAAIHRARQYVHAGADAIFPEGLQSLDEFRRFRDALDVPLLANMTEFGKTPLITFQEFASIGYEMVIYPMTAFRVMLKALDDAYAELLRAGSQAGLLNRMRSRQELYDLLSYSEFERLDRELADN
jgi:methylisocitrate lyase